MMAPQVTMTTREVDVADSKGVIVCVIFSSVLVSITNCHIDTHPTSHPVCHSTVLFSICVPPLFTYLADAEDWMWINASREQLQGDDTKGGGNGDMCCGQG